MGRNKDSRPDSGSSIAAWTDKSFDKIPEEKELETKNETPPNEEKPISCWGRFMGCLCGLWGTRDMSDTDDREIFVQTSIRELVVYMIFLLDLCVLTIGMASTDMYYFTSVMQEAFKNQMQVQTVNDFWQWMEGELLDGLYWETMYNQGKDKQFICPNGKAPNGPCPIDPIDRGVLYENKMLGLPRIRQLRVHNDSCLVHPNFQNAIKVCYGKYSQSNEDKYPFGPGFRKFTSDSAWRYNKASFFGGALEHRAMHGTYSGSGSIQDLASLRNESVKIIEELREGLWVERGTRYVVIDFTVYNANINYFCIVRFCFEFLETGGVLPSSVFRTVKLLRYLTALDYFVMACEFTFCCFIFYYIIEEGLEISKHKCKYFSNVWNILDVTVICISIVCVSFYVIMHFYVEDIVESLLRDPEKHANFDTLGYLTKQNGNALAVCAFFSWVKVFKYISFNKTMSSLTITLQRCSRDVANFMVMFGIIFFAFAQLGNLLFGSNIEGFSTLSDSFFTLLRTILGDFDFRGLQTANRTLGPIYFVVYILFVFFVLLNMFLAIINDTYSEVKAELAGKRNEFEMGDYFKRGYNNVLGAMGKRDKSIDFENAIKLANADGNVTYDEIRHYLKQSDFSDLEIDMFFSEYDTDGDGDIEGKETIKVLEDIDNNRINQRPKSGKEARQLRSARIARANGMEEPRKVTREDMNDLNFRIDECEASLGLICDKLDGVISRMESASSEKARRKQQLDKIFEGLTEDE